MRLELIKMPKEYGQSDFTSYRRYVITINGIIVEELREGSIDTERRSYFDNKVRERIAIFEQALGVKAKRYRVYEEIQ